MARKTKEIIITEEGRDKGKKYLITEMSAFDTEKWATRAINAIFRNATPNDIEELLPIFYSYLNQVNNDEITVDAMKKEAETDDLLVLSPSFVLGTYLSRIIFTMDYEDLMSVTDNLIDCCKAVEGKGQTFELTSTFVEEADTIYTLKREAFFLHIDFFTSAAKRKVKQILAASANPN